jgi:hypothetical protein
MTRVSYATWAIDGPKGRILVRRLARQSYLVGHAGRPLIPRFFTRKFRTKTEAITLAQTMAGVRA